MTRVSGVATALLYHVSVGPLGHSIPSGGSGLFIAKYRCQRVRPFSVIKMFVQLVDGWKAAGYRWYTNENKNGFLFRK